MYFAKMALFKSYDEKTTFTELSQSAIDGHGSSLKVC